jgi:hypothetical protein
MAQIPSALNPAVDPENRFTRTWYQFFKDVGFATGTVTNVSVVTANGISGVVTNPTSIPAITLTLGNITPASVAATGSVTGSNLSGNNTGDQPNNVSGGFTGNTSFTAGRVLFGDGTNPIATSSDFTWSSSTGLLSKKGISSKGSSNGTGTELFGLGAADALVLATTNNTLVGADAQQTGNAGYETDNVLVGTGTRTSGSNNSITGSGAATAAFVSFCSLFGSGNSAAGSYSTILGALNTISTSYNIGCFGTQLTLSHQGGAMMGGNISSKHTYELGLGFASDGVAGTPFHVLLQGQTSAYTPREIMRWSSAWIDSTDATRKARSIHSVFDTAEREYLRADATGSGVNSFMSGGWYPPDDAGAIQTSGAFRLGAGVPNNANGSNGDIYFRPTGGAGAYIYVKAAGAWAAIL